MLNKILLSNNNQQLSANDIAQLVFEDALQKMSQLSGLNRRAAIDALAAQPLFENIERDTLGELSLELNTPKAISVPNPTPILDPNEVEFITNLFH